MVRAQAHPLRGASREADSEAVKEGRTVQGRRRRLGTVPCKRDSLGVGGGQGRRPCCGTTWSCFCMRQLFVRSVYPRCLFCRLRRPRTCFEHTGRPASRPPRALTWPRGGHAPLRWLEVRVCACALCVHACAAAQVRFLEEYWLGRGFEARVCARVPAFTSACVRALVRG